MDERFERRKVLQVTREVIHAWDPFDLIANGAPTGEFDDEIARLVALVPHLCGPADASAAVSAVFLTAFEGEEFTPAACSEIGCGWYDRLRNAGLVQTPD